MRERKFVTIYKFVDSINFNTLILMSNERSLKQLMFNDDDSRKRGRPLKTLLEQVISNKNISIDEFCKKSVCEKVWDCHRVSNNADKISVFFEALWPIHPLIGTKIVNNYYYYYQNLVLYMNSWVEAPLSRARSLTAFTSRKITPSWTPIKMMFPK